MQITWGEVWMRLLILHSVSSWIAHTLTPPINYFIDPSQAWAGGVASAVNAKPTVEAHTKKKRYLVVQKKRGISANCAQFMRPLWYRSMQNVSCFCTIQNCAKLYKNVSSVQNVSLNAKLCALAQFNILRTIQLRTEKKLHSELQAARIFSRDTSFFLHEHENPRYLFFFVCASVGSRRVARKDRKHSISCCNQVVLQSCVSPCCSLIVSYTHEPDRICDVTSFAVDYSLVW